MDRNPLVYATRDHVINLDNVSHITFAKEGIVIEFVGGKTISFDGHDAQTVMKQLNSYFVKID